MSDEYKAAQAQLMLEQAGDVDVIITTALIPGRKAPVLVNQDMLDVMKPGSGECFSSHRERLSSWTLFLIHLSFACLSKQFLWILLQLMEATLHRRKQTK